MDTIKHSPLQDKSGFATDARDYTLPLGWYNTVTLKNREFPPQLQAVEDLLPAGLAILAGAPKTGKSWLALNIACAVASGGMALSRFDVSQGEALYLALEDNPRRLQSRFLTLLGDYEEWPETMPIAGHEVTGGWSNLQPLLNQWLDAYPNARLIVIDTFAKVRPPRGKHEDAYQHDYVLAAQLQKLALARNVCLLLVHHTKKGPEEDFLSSVSGTHGITGAADCVLVLQRKRGEQQGILSVTGRDIEERDLALTMTDGDWVCLGDATEVHRSESRQKIIDTLEKTSPLTPVAIAMKADMNRGTVRRLLSYMLTKGEVQKVGDTYTL